MARAAAVVVSGLMQIINQRTELVPIDSVHPHERNVNQGNLGAIHESIEHTGFYGTIVAQESSGRVLAGNHRLVAMRQAGATEIPVTYVDVDDETALRILLVDNRSTREGVDDSSALAVLLQELAATPAALQGTGYDGDALDELLADLGQGQPELALAQDGGQQNVPEQWMVMVECTDEAQQVSVLERLSADGLKCRALVS